MKVSATLFGLKHYVQKTREHYTIPNNISRHLMFEWEDRKSKYLARGHHVWTKYNVNGSFPVAIFRHYPPAVWNFKET